MIRAVLWSPSACTVLSAILPTRQPTGPNDLGETAALFYSSTMAPGHTLRPGRQGNRDVMSVSAGDDPRKVAGRRNREWLKENG
jgi:hypothetical protein